MIKSLSSFTLTKAFNKGFRQGSKLYKAGFLVIVIFKIIKFLSSKAKPQTFQQYDLDPGEYKVVVQENNKRKK